MNLLTRKDVDFTDAHLWSANAKFHTSIPVRKLAELIPLLTMFSIKFYSHEREHGADVTVHVTLQVEKFEPEITCNGIKSLFAHIGKLGYRITMEYEKICVVLDSNFRIEERWHSDN